MAKKKLKSIKSRGRGRGLIYKNGMNEMEKMIMEGIWIKRKKKGKKGKKKTKSTSRQYDGC